MDEKVKGGWLKALRSGKYKQGQGRLRGLDNRFCCLGVLCDIVDPTDWEASPYDRNPTDGRYEWDNSTSSLNNPHAQGITRGQQEELIQMNDDGFTFEEIAAWIEKNL